AGRNGVAMRAGFGVAKECANALVQLRADDVLEPAGLRVRFGFVDGKGVLEQALCQTMAAHHVPCALAPLGSELSLPVMKGNQMQIRHARENTRGRFFGRSEERRVGKKWRERG